MAPASKLKLRRDIAARWSITDPVLADGEPGFEKDTGMLKIGDGITAWRDLPYFIPHDPNVIPTPGDPSALLAHINSSAPHPTYDDGRNFELLYENAKV